MLARFVLLTLLHGTAVLTWEEISVIVEKESLPTGPPNVLSYYPDHDFFMSWTWKRHYYRDCPEDKKKRAVADLDMRKMMGRWFVGITHKRYHNRLKPRSSCFVYEFDRLLIIQNTTSFDVTINYKSPTKYPMKEFSFMRAIERRKGLFTHFTSTSLFGFNQYGIDFWVYKLGPEGRDSFGRAQYEYAVIGHCIGISLVLVRNPQAFKDIYKNEIMSWMEASGYGIDLNYPFNQPSYSTCFADSVTSSYEWSQDAPLATHTPIHLKPESNFTCDPNNNTLAEDFDTRKMMGRWFEGLSSLSTENQACIVHEYRWLEFVGANFTNDGHYTISFEAIRKHRDEKNPLSMQKDDAARIWSNDEDVPKFGSQFWVYKAGPEAKDFTGRVKYEYLIVSNCEKSFVRVLVRNPYMFNEIYKRSVLIWLEQNGFNVGEENGIYQPDYSSCNYADSITEQIGQY